MKVFRRQMIVDKGFQYKQIATAVLTTIIVANSMIVAAFVFFPYEFRAVMGPFTWTIGFLEVFLIVSVFYIGLRASHRIAGPAFSLKRSLVRLGDGDLSARSRLRKADHLKDVADVFNENVERLGDRIDAIRLEAENLRDSLPADSPGREHADQLASRLGSFSSSNPSGSKQAGSGRQGASTRESDPPIKSRLHLPRRLERVASTPAIVVGIHYDQSCGRAVSLGS